MTSCQHQAAYFLGIRKRRLFVHYVRVMQTSSISYPVAKWHSPKEGKRWCYPRSDSRKYRETKNGKTEGNYWKNIKFVKEGATTLKSK